MQFPNMTLWPPRMSARHASLLLSLLLAGCTAFGTRTAGTSGPLTWQATALHLQPTALPVGQEYGFTLILQETTGTTFTLTRLEGSVQNAVGSRPVYWAHTGHWVVPAHGELRIPFTSYRNCPYVHCHDLGTFEPAWSITLIGTEGDGQPVRHTLTLRLPASPPVQEP